MTQQAQCAAMDWDKTRRAYVECSPRGEVIPVKLLGLFSIVVQLCPAHRKTFEKEFAKFGGQLDQKKRVVAIKERRFSNG